VIPVLYLVSEVPVPDLFWPRLAYWVTVFAATGLAVFAFILLTLGWRVWSGRERLRLFLLVLFL
jgi:hypothetical protein